MQKILKNEMATWNDYSLWMYACGQTKLSKDLFKVALCELHCNNNKLIELLSERGQYMKKKNIAKVEYCNQKIDFTMKLLRDDLVRPNCAFVTFMNKKDRDFAIKCQKKFENIAGRRRPKFR